MSSAWISTAVLLLLTIRQHPDRFDGALRAEPAKDKDEVIVVKMPKRPRTGRLGELTLEEEARLDKIINDFIAFDIASQSSPAAARMLDGLGPEAIPALVRGLNKSAGYSYSCPVTVLASKLIDLIRKSEDPEVLRFIRTEAGAGVTSMKYAGLLNRVKAETVMRQGELARRLKEAQRNRPKSPGDDPGKNPGKDR